MISVKFVGRSQHLSDAGYSIEEQEELYDDTLKDVYNNPRWYLDNLDNLSSYKVAWKDYKSKTCTVPYRFTKKGIEKHKSL